MVVMRNFAKYMSGCTLSTHSRMAGHYNFAFKEAEGGGRNVYVIYIYCGRMCNVASIVTRHSMLPTLMRSRQIHKSLFFTVSVEDKKNSKRKYLIKDIIVIVFDLL